MQPARPLVSEAEFLSLPESNDKVELMDGEVVVSPSPSYWHQEVLARIVGALRAWAASQERPVTVGQAPLDVRFGEGRILQPDAFVLLSAVSRDLDGPIDRVPELCIEVLSTNRVFDRVTKRFIYAEAGVAEYWTVEPAGVVERWTGPALSKREVVEGRLTSIVLPGLTIELTAIFGDA